MMSALPPPLLASHHHFLLPSLPFFRYQSGILSNQRKNKLHGKVMASLDSSLNPTLQNGIFCRRDLMLVGLSTSLSLFLPFSGSNAEEEVKMASVIDDINAYSYLYPVELPSKKFVFKWVESRKPERYSSAAPLSPDARLRIVSERVDIIDNLVISISIGPPNAQILKSKEKSTWSAKDVADSVLADKSALRVTSTQRLAESSVLDSHSSEVDGEPYWYYEYLVRKSPTRIAQESNLYRHYVASTAERDGRIGSFIFIYCINNALLPLRGIFVTTKMGIDKLEFCQVDSEVNDLGSGPGILSSQGVFLLFSEAKFLDQSDLFFGTSTFGLNHWSFRGYLYSLSASTLSKQWNDMGHLLQKTVASFRLLPPTENYVPPYKDPWRFW